MIKIVLFLAYASTVIAQPCIVWSRADGGVSITHPVWSNRRTNETTSAFLERIALRSEMPDFVSREVKDIGVIPSDRYFRDAWVPHGNGISVARDKAEKIHRARLHGRAATERQKLLAEWNEAQALGESEKAAAVSAKLSEVTSAAIEAMDLSVDAAPNLTDLKSRVPDALRKPGDPVGEEP